MNRENLNKLADYLISLPPDYVHFNMEAYFKVDDWLTDFHTHPPTSYDCGTTACAVGHGPAAGIFPPRDGPRPNSWDGYSDMVFGLKGRDWDWCFSYLWIHVDNTPQGAGKRIKYLLEHGVPQNYASQLYGAAELCYEP